MKLEDITVPLSNLGHYEINVSFSSIESCLKHYEESFNLDYNPDFQRDYVWTKKQQKSYVEYLLRGGKSSRVICFNYPYWGSFTQKGVMQLIDGKQRLNAVRLFINNKLKVFDGYYLSDFEDSEIICRRCDLLFNVNNMKTRKEILQWYIDFNSGGTIHSKEDIDKVKLLLKKEN